MTTHAEAVAQLTAPGGPFAIVETEVDGVPMRMYESRFGSLRDVLAMGSGHGDATFIVYGDRRISFAEFAAEANSIAAALAERGVGRGDRVAVLSANNPEWCTTFWATVSLGAILVGLNGWWKTDEVLYGLTDSGAKVLVADGPRFERIAAEVAGGQLPDLEAVFLIDGDPASGGERAHPFSDLTAGGPAPAPTGEIDETDAAVIFYTSGTTGRPKGAISTHRSMVANLQNTVLNSIATRMAMPEPDGAEPAAAGGQTVGLLTSPLFHVAGCHSNLVVSMLGGVRIVIPEGRFDPENVLRLIQEEGVAIWATVPTMVWRVCEHPSRDEYDTSTVTTVAFGGSPSAGELQRKVKETFPNVAFTTNAYGLTESSSVATTLTGEDSARKPDSVGRPVPVVDVRIDDGAGGSLPPGATGEVCLRGPIIMPGYWNKPEATAEVIRDGWLHTGDVGHVDDEGFLFITDRAKDMIIRGGENVYCVEIENRLVEHPSIADAAVIGVPHPSLGEEVKAVVQTEPGRTITEDEVRAWVGEVLAGFKVPAHVEVREEKLPRNASGKLLKNLLRGSGDVSLAETL
ncbi:MAG: long-chain fatty acid--CoA ligase [Acidimicrobiales bacterium]|nr:long-chain fatty acid--CoA ligase [Acidimicrobiales bacterium]